MTPPGESPKSAILAIFKKTPEFYGRDFSIFAISWVSNGERKNGLFFVYFRVFSCFSLFSINRHFHIKVLKNL